MSTVFPSKVDGRLVVFTAGVPLIFLIVVARSVILAGETLIALLILFFALMSIFWLLFRTYYELSEDVLAVHSGPFRWKIQLMSITSIEASQDLRSAPALSLDRLKIVYGAGHIILVSPRDKAAFLAAIRKATGTRSTRV